MPKNPSRKLVKIAREAKRRAVRSAMKRFSNDRSRVADYFGMTVQGIGHILTRE